MTLDEVRTAAASSEAVKAVWERFAPGAGKFTFVLARNPFDLSAREIAEHLADGRALADVVEAAGLDPTEFDFVANGSKVDGTFMPAAGDYAAALPHVGKGGGGGKKNMLGIIALIALTVFTMGSGGGLGGALGGLFGGKSGILILGALLALGGGLLGNVGKTPTVDMPSGSAWENSPSWGNMKPLATQGNPVPMTYGTVRATGTIIAQHISTDGKNQYLNLLLSAGEGPLDSFSGFLINGNPPENYRQTESDNVNKTISQDLNESTWTTATTDQDNVTSLKVAVKAKDLYHRATDGTIYATWIDVAYEYRVAGSAGDWSALSVIRLDGSTLYAAARNYYRPIEVSTKEATVSGLAPSAYEIRAKIAGKKTWSDGGTTVNTCSWLRVSSVKFASDVAIETRLGTNDQTAIPFFSDTYADQFVSAELRQDDWTVYQTESNGIQGLEVTVEFPGGLQYVKDDGGADKNWVDLTFEYRLVGAVNWSTLISSARVEEALSRAVRRSFRVDNITTGQYEVRAKIAAVMSTSATRSVNKCVWAQLTGIIYDDFARPNKALVAIRALATDKLSGGMPSISWLQTRANVWVWSPTENGGAGGYVQRAATNPAWVAYDLIHRARRLKNTKTGQFEMVVFGEPAARINYADFVAWAAFCDEVVDEQARCAVNIYLDGAAGLWEQLQKVAALGRGAVIERGTQFAAIWDGASSPVALFTVGNVALDSLQGEYLGSKDRANAAEVTFYNEDRNYERDTIIVYGEGYNESARTLTPTQVSLIGITNYRRAYREALYRLRLNRYLRRTATWKADVDSIQCQVGDVVLLQHDVPRWGYGGRLTGATTTELTLDKKVLLEAGKTYQVKVRFDDDTLVERTLAAVSETIETDIVEVTVAFSEAPPLYAPYALGETNKVAKPFRVTRIGRSSDQRMSLSAIEYYPEVYDESATVPTINYSIALPTMNALRLAFYFDLAGYGYLDISWTPPRGSYGGAVVQVDGVTVGRATATERDYQHRVIADNVYAVTVIGLDAAGRELAPLTGSFSVEALSIPTCSDIAIEENSYILGDGTVLTDVPATFTLPGYEYFKAVNVYYEIDGSGTFTFAGQATAGEFTIKALKATTVRVNLRIVNRFGVEGAPALSETLTLVGKSWPPADVTGFSAAQDAINRAVVNLSWNRNADLDLREYEVRVGATWEDGTPLPVLYEPRTSYTVPASGSYTFHVKARDASLNYSTNAASASLNVDAQPSTPGAATVTQDAADRSYLVVAWGKIADPDLKEYEVRRGATWEDGTLVGITKETSIRDRQTVNGTYSYIVRARNWAGFESADRAASATVTITPTTPGAGSIAQDPLNRAVLVVTWPTVSDTDLKEYEIRKGATWETADVVAVTRETAARYTISAGGSHTFLVVARNAAGLNSAPRTIAATVSIAASDVADFASAQATNDKSKVRLTWTAVSDTDFDHYEVRRGATWETGTPVGRNITGVFMDDVVAASSTYTWWIRAFNKSGTGSSTAASTALAVDLAPSTPTNLTAAQRIDDRSVVVIEWDVVTDADLKEYEIRQGGSWEGGTLIAITKEHRLEHRPAASELLRYHVKARNLAGATSAAATTTLDAVLEPVDIADLQAYQDGEAIDIVWDASTEPDVVGYEIREGGGWDAGVLIATGLTSPEFIFPVSTERTYTFTVKAINRGGFYSLNAAVAVVTIDDLPPKNVINSYDEIALASGTHTLTEFGSSYYTFATMGGRFSDYPSLRFNEIGAATVLKLSAGALTGNYLTVRKDLGAPFTVNISDEFIPAALLATTASARLMFRTSRDGATFSDWKAFFPHQSTFRYIDFRADLVRGSASDPCEVVTFKEFIDVPDIVKSGIQVVAAGGTTVPFGYTYYSTPSVTATAIGATLRAVITAVTTTGFTIKVLDTNGNDVGGTANWQARGY